MVFLNSLLNNYELVIKTPYSLFLQNPKNAVSEQVYKHRYNKILKRRSKNFLDHSISNTIFAHSFNYWHNHMKKSLFTLSTLALFAGAAMAAEPTKTLESIENVDSFDVTSGEYVQASGAYYRDGGLPDGKLHRGPVVNVGSMSIDGIFEVKASDQDANRLFDVKDVSGTGEIRFGRGVYISQESNLGQYQRLWNRLIF